MILSVALALLWCASLLLIAACITLIAYIIVTELAGPY